MVSRDFYPAAAIGCHRTGKFCKYLGEYGWRPTVLTVREEFLHGPRDPALLAQLPADLEIARTFYPDERRLAARVRRLLGRLRPRPDGSSGPLPAPAAGKVGLQRWLGVPDPSLAWLPWALRAGLPLARRCDAVYVTAPPHGAVVVAAVLSRLAKRPLVIDFRDPWMLDRTLIHPSALHRWLNERLERWCIRGARRVVVNTPRAEQAYRRRFPDAPAEKFVTIPNGFDPADFEMGPSARRPREPGQPVAFAYVGNLHGGRDPGPLLRAARQVQERRSAAGPPIAVRFWSFTEEIVRECVRREGAEAIAEVHPAVPHREALRAMLDSDVLLLFGAADTDELHVAGKLFEYVYCRKPVLALVEEGAITDLIDRYRLGLWCSPRDEARIADCVEALVDHAGSGEPWPIAPEAFRDFDRRRQAGQLAAVLRC